MTLYFYGPLFVIGRPTVDHRILEDFRVEQLVWPLLEIPLGGLSTEVGTIEEIWENGAGVYVGTGTYTGSAPVGSKLEVGADFVGGSFTVEGDPMASFPEPTAVWRLKDGIFRGVHISPDPAWPECHIEILEQPYDRDAALREVL